MAQLNFDARQVAPATGFETVPPGWYNVIVDESEMKPTKAEGGAYLKVRYSILDGQYAGRKLFGNINLQNANPQAVEIGLKQLSALAHAVGVLMVADSQQLHNIPLKIKVKVRKDTTGQYEDQNEVQQWKNINEPVEGAAPAAGAAAFAPPAGAPAGFPGAAAPPAQPWAQPPSAAPAAAAPAWGAPPAAAPAAPAAAAPPSWSAPPAAAAPWAGAPAAPAAPVPPQAPPAAPAAAPTGFNPAGAVPPWAQK